MQEIILVFFQNHSSHFLDILVEGVTISGEQSVFIVVIALLFWCFSKKYGFMMSVSLLLSVTVNGVLKIIFRKPRPFEVLDFIKARRVHTATGYSFPSGHTQSGTAFYFTAASIIRSRAAWAGAILISMLIAVSRVYLGVHWPVDVIASLFLGSILAIAVSSFMSRIYNNSSQLNLFVYCLIGLVSLALIIMLVLEFTVFQGSIKITDFFKGSGVFLGLLCGFLLDRRYLNYSSSKGSLRIKTVRYVTGVLFLAMVLHGLKIIFPDHIISHTIRYALVGLSVTFLYPLAGTRLGLFEKV